ncbi:MAG: polysaccharide pyruvyl transferase family protein [Oscillospiraceae bacterium]|nr:polysaccharide pyruvyl transferase family protein [Oscillospiraceae bacterium]
MKKIGIITHYYHSLNYGGTLQAYALCRVLNDMGYTAEQICYDMTIPARMKSVSKRLTQALRKKCYALRHAWTNIGWKKRKAAFLNFQNAIPHSKQVYDRLTIRDFSEDYDIFITGSDQVWNTDWYHPAFFLDFVPAGKPKIAYAASLGMTELNDRQQKAFEHSLKDYTAISVREQDSVDMISMYAPCPVVHTADPSMLLTSQQWDQLCSARVVQEPYIFSFLLGTGEAARRLVREFANTNHIKVVSLPHFPQAYHKEDKNFADINLYDISPAQFVSLIKHAEYIFTDSFHAAVFSGIYQKEYFVLDRPGKQKMHVRLQNLMSLHGSHSHYLYDIDKLNPEMIGSIEKINYESSAENLNNWRTDSLTFLKKALEA